MKTLIVVDLQRDFYHPEGALYVKGGEEAMKEVVELVKNDRTINQVVLTVDWHNPEDHSFEVNGGTWPIHCVQYSVGASLPPELMTAIIGRGFKSVDGSYYLAGVKDEVTKQFLAGTYDVFQKGDVPGEEEYGAFSEYDGLEDGDSDLVCMTGASGDSCAYLNVKNDVVVAGLAGDYCVLETAKNLKEILDGEDGEGKLMMYLPGIASIDDGSKLKEWMAKNKVTSYDPNENTK